MKKSLFIISFFCYSVSVVAQETYENARLLTTNLNGTARYVGMGGAMDALGADISTISTNPAGVGMMRHSSISVSLGLQSQQDAQNFGTGHTTNFSFDQAGFVWSQPSGSSTLNFAFNYHKSRNFNYILQASNSLNQAAQNKLTLAKVYDGMVCDVYRNGVPNFNSVYSSCNQLDAIYAEHFLYSPADTTWNCADATSYDMHRGQSGYISDFDFNISGGNGRVYLGLTVGIHDVHYKHYGLYEENLVYDNQNHIVSVADDRHITGQGIDIKAGIIVRPIESSPLRFGLNVATPTWYTLTTSNTTTVNLDTRAYTTGESYKFKLFTPWKFGASAGYTIGSDVALGLGYDYASHGSTDTRVITGERYVPRTDSYSVQSESEENMNRHTSSTLKGVHTLKVGAEVKVAPTFAVRAGYNYVSPMYQSSGYKDGTLDCEGSYYSSSTDYTNWKATHRLTCGFGYQMNHWNFAVAYQYSTTKGDFYPFTSWVGNRESEDYDPSYDNVTGPTEVSNKRHNVMATVSYTF